MHLEEPPKSPDGPPSMAPPTEPPPDLTLPPVDSFEGYVPPRAPAAAARLQPPWTQARKPHVRLARAKRGHQASSPAGRARLTRRPAAAVRNPWSKGASASFDSFKAEHGSRASSASSTTSKRPPPTQRMRTPTPPPPPPPKMLSSEMWCSAGWDSSYGTHATPPDVAHPGSRDHPSRTMQPNRKTCNVRPHAPVPGVRSRSDAQRTSRRDS